MKMEFPGVIHTERLLLRPVEESDIEDLLTVNGDEEVTRHLPYKTWLSIKDGEAWYRRMTGLMDAGDTLQLVMVERQSGQAIGTCLLFRYDSHNGSAELGYVMGRAHWQKGYTHEALSALIDCAIEVYGVRRLEAEVEPGNVASNNLLLKLGFVREGCLRQRWRSKVGICDSNIYGLLSQEWFGADR